MPSRKGLAKSRPYERRGDFVIEGAPKITKHARQRMQERNVKHSDIVRNKKSAGIITNEATGEVITVIPDSFVHQQQQKRQQKRLSQAASNNSQAAESTNSKETGEVNKANNTSEEKPDHAAAKSVVKKTYTYPASIANTLNWASTIKIFEQQNNVKIVEKKLKPKTRKKIISLMITGEKKSAKETGKYLSTLNSMKETTETKMKTATGSDDSKTITGQSQQNSSSQSAATPSNKPPDDPPPASLDTNIELLLPSTVLPGDLKWDGKQHILDPIKEEFEALGAMVRKVQMVKPTHTEMKGATFYLWFPSKERANQIQTIFDVSVRKIERSCPKLPSKNNKSIKKFVVNLIVNEMNNSKQTTKMKPGGNTMITTPAGQLQPPSDSQSAPSNKSPDDAPPPASLDTNIELFLSNKVLPGTLKWDGKPAILTPIKEKFEALGAMVKKVQMVVKPTHTEGATFHLWCPSKDCADHYTYKKTLEEVARRKTDL